jgi:hypothetical protein
MRVPGWLLRHPRGTGAIFRFIRAGLLVLRRRVDGIPWRLGEPWNCSKQDRDKEELQSNRQPPYDASLPEG